MAIASMILWNYEQVMVHQTSSNNYNMEINASRHSELQSASRNSQLQSASPPSAHI